MLLQEASLFPFLFQLLRKLTQQIALTVAAVHCPSLPTPATALAAGLTDTMSSWYFI